MNHSRVLWVKVWGIAAVQGAITLSWVIYNLYLPILLVQLGLSKQLALVLLIVENALEALIEPAFGRFSDRQQQLSGSRIPIITLGIILSSALFLALPSLAVFAPDNGLGNWLFPILAVAWASAMAIFRSPAMALLGRCSNISRLPQAASILTLTGGLIGAFRFDAYGLILQLGAGFAFAVGSFSLLVAGAILRQINPPQAATTVENQSKPMSISRLGLIFMTGIAVGWGLRFLVPTVKQILALQIGEENSKIAMTVFFIVLGLSALPAGKLSAKLGNSVGMMWGCFTVIAIINLAAFIPNSTIKYTAIAFLPFGFSLVLNGAVPYALSLASAIHSGLSTGIYFGGLNAGISLFGLLSYKLGKTDITTGTLGTVLSFLLVLICLSLSNRIISQERYQLS